MSEKTESFLISDLMAQSGVGFGTSGARGLVEAMTDRVCYSYTVGFLQFLEKSSAIRPGDEIVLAGDFRPSSPRIISATAQAVADLGYVPVNAGRIPTPALAAYAMSRKLASLMVTGSHIPDDRNGIKFYKPDGEILKGDEENIRQQQVSVPRALFSDEGAFHAVPFLPAEDGTALRHYIARFLDFFPPGCLAGARVLVYEHSTVAASAMTEVFGGLGADVIRRGYSDVFVPVDTEAVRPEDAALAARWAEDEAVDLIASADGDGDRPLVGDERGTWLRGDMVGILTSHYLDAANVVTPVSSNSAVERCGWFERVLRTRIGSPYVIEGMRQAAEGPGVVVGYEANGGFLQYTPISLDGRTLSPLPTRDAIIVLLAVLLSARRQGLPVSQLASLLPKRFTASGRITDVPSVVSIDRLAGIVANPELAAATFPGLGKLDGIDQTDGLRMTFGDDEIVHIRPSGNAPELRCYTEAATCERAEQLNVECLSRLRSWRA